MTTPGLTIAATILQSFGFIMLYFVIGFGPGFIAGILLANALFGRGLPTHKDSHAAGGKKAFEHNAQWDPNHERWQ